MNLSRQHLLVSACVVGAAILAEVGGPAAAQKAPAPLTPGEVEAVLRSGQDARDLWDYCGTDGRTYLATYRGILLARAAGQTGKPMPETLAASPDPGRVVAARAYPLGPEFNEQANEYTGGGTITSLVIGTKRGEHVVAPLRMEVHEGVWKNLIQREIGRYQWVEALFDYDAVAALPPGDLHLLAQDSTSVCRVSANKRAKMFN